ERLERRERAPIVAAKLERFLVVRAREVAIAELGARELADAQARRELHVFVEDVREDLALQGDELRVTIGGDGEPLGPLEPSGDLGLSSGFANAAHGVGEGPSCVVLLDLGDGR